MISFPLCIIELGELSLAATDGEPLNDLGIKWPYRYILPVQAAQRFYAI
jgi:hypothetical protein